MDSSRQALAYNSTVLYSKKQNRVRDFLRGSDANCTDASEQDRNGSVCDLRNHSDVTSTGLCRSKTLATIDVNRRKNIRNDQTATFNDSNFQLKRTMSQMLVRRKPAEQQQKINTSMLQSVSLSTFDLRSDVIEESTETDTFTSLADINGNKPTIKSKPKLKSASFSSFDYAGSLGPRHLKTAVIPKSKLSNRRCVSIQNLNAKEEIANDNLRFLHLQSKKNHVVNQSSPNLKRSQSLKHDGSYSKLRRNSTKRKASKESQDLERVDSAAARLDIRLNSARQSSAFTSRALPYQTRARSPSPPRNNTTQRFALRAARSQSARRDAPRSQATQYQQSRPKTGHVSNRNHNNHFVESTKTRDKSHQPAISRTADKGKARPSVVKWNPDLERETTSPAQLAEQSESNDRMSTELPPIHNRPDSSLSKRTYSRESLSNLSQHTPVYNSGSSGIVIHRQDKPARISIDCPPINSGYSDTNPAPLSSPTRKYHVSPGSQHSESSNNSKGYSSQNAGSLSNIHRNKSWGTLESTPKPALETLFEANKNQLAANGADSGVESSGTDNKFSKPGIMRPPTNQLARRTNTSNSLQVSTGKQATSTSNLTKTSDNSSGKNNNSTGHITSLTKPIKRIQSENSLGRNNQQNARPLGNQQLSSQNTTATNVGKAKTMSRTKSQPNFPNQNDRTGIDTAKSKHFSSTNRGSTRGQSTKGVGGRSETNDSCDDEEQTKERVVQWLLGLERAETPPTQHIIDDTPEQTDTAIHVVYNGD